MTNKPNVTIVIPTRNRCDLLKETISSVLSQSYGNWELIIVDDASDDTTWSWLQGIDDARVRTIRLEHHSERSKARNVGLQAAKGPFILFLDDDDLLPEIALQKHIEAIEQYPDAIASIGSRIMFDEKGARRTYKVIRRSVIRNIWKDFLCGWAIGMGQYLLRTETVKLVNGWNESYIIAEDYELWLRLARLGPVVLIPDIVFLLRVHSGQWRPAKLYNLMADIRQQAVKQVHGKEREISDRIIRAKEIAMIASEHFNRDEVFRAFTLYLKVLRIAPYLLLSPLTREIAFVPMMKCLAGKIGIRIWRLIFFWLLWVVKGERKIDTSCTTVDSDGRWHGAKHSGGDVHQTGVSSDINK